MLTDLTYVVSLSSYGKGDFRCGTVLVFLPGLPEIMEVKEALGNSSR